MIKFPDETEMKWRDLALQFDAHRMQAISLLKMIIKDVPDDQYLLARNFIESAPLPGEEVLRNRIAEIAEVQRLNATAQPVSDGWVKCSERMPEDAQWCLVYTDYGQFAQCWSNNTNRGWLGDEISIPNIDVTHWMPLPAAPGGQDD